MMFRRWTQSTRQALLGSLLAGFVVGGAYAAQQGPDASALLQRADSIKTSNHAEFTEILKTLEERAPRLPPAEQEYVRYLRGWQAAYVGDYEASLATLRKFVPAAKDPTLQFRARVTMVNVLSIARRYEEAFSELSQLIDQLEQVSDPSARAQGLGVAALLYGDVGQHDLSLVYADKVIAENFGGQGVCRGGQLKVRSLYDSTRPDDRPATLQQEIRKGIDGCVAVGEITFANVIRGYQARLYMERGELQEALDLLSSHYDEVKDSQYPRLISQYDVLLAQLHWRMNDAALARRYALRAIQGGVKNEFTEPLVQAYHLLYSIDKEFGNTRSALGYHESYAEADKGYLDDISARQLAFERVRHEVSANRLQIESLKLQRELDAKEIENVRLYVALLAVIIAFIAFWAYRTKRSELHFMDLSRRDGLTGIFNRPHFMTLAASTLENCHKLKQEVALIVCDLDHFKQINDRFGHPEGDKVLRDMVRACQSHLRAADVFARIGGEEFCILLPACGVDDARERAEELRKAIAALSESNRATVSASFGVTGTERSGYDLHQLLAHADAALYEAKRAGRDHVIVYDKESIAAQLRQDPLSTAT